MRTIIIYILLCMVHITANAGRIEYGKHVVINEPVYENLYIAAGTADINAPVHGDLIIAGGTITINDSVFEDVLVAGGRLLLKGYVAGDIRCAMGTIEISRNVDGDVVVAGGNVVIDRGITVGQLIMTGGDVELNGNVKHSITGRFGRLNLRGETGEWLDVKGDEILINGMVHGNAAIAAREITIGPAAVFAREVRYWSRSGAADFKQSVRSGNAIYDRSLGFSLPRWYYLGAASIAGMLVYLGMGLVMIFLTQLLFGKVMNQAAERLSSSPAKSLGWGLLFLLAMPVIIAMVMITVVGVPVGLLLLMGYVVVLVFSSVITAVVSANWVNTIYHKGWGRSKIILMALGIFMLLKLLSLASYTGWTIILLAVCTAFGSIILSLKKSRIARVA